MLGFALFFSGFIACIQKNKWKLLITGAIFMCMMRLQLMVFVVPVIGILILKKWQIRPVLKVGFFLIGIVAVFILIRYFIVKNPLSPESFSKMRDISVDRSGELSYGHVDWHSYLDMVRDYPFLVLQFIFSPLPIFVQNNPLDTFLLFLDVIFMDFLLSVIIIHFRDFCKRAYRNYLPYHLVYHFFRCIRISFFRRSCQTSNACSDYIYACRIFYFCLGLFPIDLSMPKLSLLLSTIDDRIYQAERIFSSCCFCRICRCSPGD